jgi:NAD(P)-dependent dehydrogenase (short-subunit alcohol dehydrogenase family)
MTYPSKKIIITGANRGLGLGFVEHYLKSGYIVVATCRDLSKAEKLKDLLKVYKENLQIEILDLSDETDIRQFYEKIKSKKIVFNVVISNAGICIEEDFGQWTAATFESNFRINTIGPALFSQIITPFLNKGSKLVNISSGMGSIELNINPDAGLDAYAISKAALNILTKRLASKLQDKGIAVFAMNPGWVKTDMGGQAAPTFINEAISNMVKTIENLTIAHTGQFVSDEGEEIPW